MANNVSGSSIVFQRPSSSFRETPNFVASSAPQTLPGTAGLFLSPAANAHTNFRPTKIGPSRNESGAMKPPKQPEKPLMPYMRYSRRMWEKVRAANPDSKLWDIGKIIGQMWRDLPDSARHMYMEEYEFEKQEYDKAFKAYCNSPAYQAYLMSKSRSKGSDRNAAVQQEVGVFVQPVDEDEEGQFYVKQLASARFHRNHRLMREIFNEALVPDARNVITTHRLGVLKKQVTSLTLHQNKLEDELKHLEMRFESKKRQLTDASSEFSVALKQICTEPRPAYEELVDGARVKLLNAYEKYKKDKEKEKEREKELEKLREKEREKEREQEREREKEREKERERERELELEREKQREIERAKEKEKELEIEKEREKEREREREIEREKEKERKKEEEEAEKERERQTEMEEAEKEKERLAMEEAKSLNDNDEAKEPSPMETETESVKETHACAPTADPGEETAPTASKEETPAPETGVSETNVPETNVSEANVPEANVPEASVPETSVPETSVPEPLSSTPNDPSSAPNEEMEVDKPDTVVSDSAENVTQAEDEKPPVGEEDSKVTVNTQVSETATIDDAPDASQN